MNFDGTNITLAVAFIAGIVTFFASCLLPLVPVYLAYLSGVTLSTKKTEKKWVIFKTTIFFVVGFITVFVVLGATLTTFARAFAPYRVWFERAGGLLFILLGLYLSGLLKLAVLSKEVHVGFNKWFKKNRNIHALLTGMTFGFGWVPCIGPVLGVILFWASRQATYSMGILMLVVYGIGLGIPFIIVGLGFEKISPWLKKSAKFGHRLQIIAGLIIVLAGILLLTGNMQRYSLELINYFGLRRLAI